MTWFANVFEALGSLKQVCSAFSGYVGASSEQGLLERGAGEATTHTSLLTVDIGFGVISYDPGGNSSARNYVFHTVSPNFTVIPRFRSEIRGSSEFFKV